MRSVSDFKRESPDAEAAAEVAHAAAKRRAQAADLVDALADAQSGKQKEPEPEPETTPEPPVREWRGLEGNDLLRAAADFSSARRAQIGEGYERLAARSSLAMERQQRRGMRQLEGGAPGATSSWRTARSQEATHQPARHTDCGASLAPPPLPRAQRWRWSKTLGGAAGEARGWRAWRHLEHIDVEEEVQRLQERRADAAEDDLLGDDGGGAQLQHRRRIRRLKSKVTI